MWSKAHAPESLNVQVRLIITKCNQITSTITTTTTTTKNQQMRCPPNLVGYNK